MRHSSSTTSLFLALLAVQDVISGPTHSHLHRMLHKKRDVKNVNWNALDWNSMGIDWASAYAEGQSTPKPASSPVPQQAPKADAVPAPAPVSAPAPAPVIQNSPTTLNTTPDIGIHTSSKDSDSSDDSNTVPDSKSSDSKPSKSSDSSKSKPNKSGSSHESSVKLWNNLVGASNNRKSFGLSTPTRGKEVGYVSNVGIPEGSNMMKVASSDDHIFTNEFINISQEPMTVVIWNKAASEGMRQPLKADPNLGASIAPDHAALTIPLAPGESQTVAFMDESVIGWAQACETRATSGGFQTTWGEAQFNATGSGYDVSAIQNLQGSNYIMHISSVEASSCDSTETANMWITDTSTVGSGSCYIAQNTAHLITKMGGYSS